MRKSKKRTKKHARCISRISRISKKTPAPSSILGIFHPHPHPHQPKHCQRDPKQSPEPGNLTIRGSRGNFIKFEQHCSRNFDFRNWNRVLFTLIPWPEVSRIPGWTWFGRGVQSKCVTTCSSASTKLSLTSGLQLISRTLHWGLCCFSATIWSPCKCCPLMPNSGHSMPRMVLLQKPTTSRNTFEPGIGLSTTLGFFSFYFFLPKRDTMTKNPFGKKKWRWALDPRKDGDDVSPMASRISLHNMYNFVYVYTMDTVKSISTHTFDDQREFKMDDLVMKNGFYFPTVCHWLERKNTHDKTVFLTLLLFSLGAYDIAMSAKVKVKDATFFIINMTIGKQPPPGTARETEYSLPFHRIQVFFSLLKKITEFRLIFFYLHVYSWKLVWRTNWCEDGGIFGTGQRWIWNGQHDTRQHYSSSTFCPWKYGPAFRGPPHHGSAQSPIC